MPTQIFVNLPVKDLKRSIEFFTRLGYTFNPNFTDEKATCMIISDTIYAMLLVEPFFKTFTQKAVCDTSKDIESIIALSCESRAAVDELAQKAEDAGATIPKPANDMGFMYTRSFEDPDGHLWEVFYMDPAAIPHG